MEKLTHGIGNFRTGILQRFFFFFSPAWNKFKSVPTKEN